MDKPVCRLCGGKHWSYEAHVFADATNKVSNVESATNTAPESATNSVDATNRTKNRRDRAAYNAYQREYMRKHRNG